MSMQPEQENFEELRRLLVLKRYEQPPPGYFNDFSRKIVARIEAGDGEMYVSVFERWMSGAPWLLQMFRTFENKPILAGVFGMVVCGVIVSGMVYSENSSSSVVAGLLPPGQTQVVVDQPPVLTPDNGNTLTGGLVGQMASFSSTAGAVAERPSPSLFDQIRPGANIVPANFNLTLSTQH